MAYHNSKEIDASFDEVTSKLAEELKKEGFGILTEINVKETLKNKLDVDFRNYKIFGACNPPFAHKAIQLEENLGVLLPCNIVVQEINNGKIRVSFVNPLESLAAVQNPKLSEIAKEIASRLKNVLKNI